MLKPKVRFYILESHTLLDLQLINNVNNLSGFIWMERQMQLQVLRIEVILTVFITTSDIAAVYALLFYKIAAVAISILSLVAYPCQKRSDLISIKYHRILTILRILRTF